MPFTIFLSQQNHTTFQITFFVTERVHIRDTQEALLTLLQKHSRRADPGGENMLRDENGNIRYFTVHEAKLLQTFPSDFTITGSWGEALRQIGNAVPVKLATIVGKSLMETIRTENKRNVFIKTQKVG
jgi:site-specific DNA-cytosine methylase